MWYVYTMEYYATIKKKEVLQFLTIWVGLEGIMLRETNQKRTNII